MLCGRANGTKAKLLSEIHPEESKKYREIMINKYNKKELILVLELLDAGKSTNEINDLLIKNIRGLNSIM